MALRVAAKPVYLMGANGFPIAMYRPAMNLLRSNISKQLTDKGVAIAPSGAVDVRGCDAFMHCGEAADWSAMIRKVVSGVEEQRKATGEPVIGIGHSFGGGLLSAAAAQRPDLFHGMILIEPPLFNASKRLLWALALYMPRAVVYRYHTMILAALKKKDSWASREDAKQYLAGKRVFSTLHPEVLDIYLKECLVPVGAGGAGSEGAEGAEGGGVRMFFDKQTEAEIYYKVPTEIPVLSKSRVGLYDFTTPGFYYYTHHKSSIQDKNDKKWIADTFEREKGQLQCREYAQSHFWPLEEPEHFAKTMAEAVVELTVRQ